MLYLLIHRTKTFCSWPSGLCSALLVVIVLLSHMPVVQWQNGTASTDNTISLTSSVHTVIILICTVLHHCIDCIVNYRSSESFIYLCSTQVPLDIDFPIICFGISSIGTFEPNFRVTVELHEFPISLIFLGNSSSHFITVFLFLQFFSN